MCTTNADPFCAQVARMSVQNTLLFVLIQVLLAGVICAHGERQQKHVIAFWFAYAPLAPTRTSHRSRAASSSRRSCKRRSCKRRSRKRRNRRRSCKRRSRKRRSRRRSCKRRSRRRSGSRSRRSGSVSSGCLHVQVGSRNM